MKYGVITVCLNSATTIAKTINSVFEQSILPDEYVFVDGGSSDNTLQIIEDAITSAHTRKLGIKFKVVHQLNKGGITEAWNIGLRELKTDIVFILNSDDWYLPFTASDVLSYFKEHPETDIILGSGLYFQNDHNIQPIVRHCRPFFTLPFSNPIIHPACFVKRSVYERIGNFDEKYRVSADYDFIYRCYKTGIRFKKNRKVLVNILTGGFAIKNKHIARYETFEIGKKYSCIPMLPRIALIIRSFLNR